MIIKIIEFLKTGWYWFFSGLLLFVFFILQGQSYGQTLYFITFLLPVVIGTSYYVNHKLIPEYLLRKAYGSFILFTIYTIIISLYLQYLIIFIAILIFTSFRLENQAIITMNIGNLSLTLYILVLIKVVIVIIQKLNQKETIIKSFESKSKTTPKPSVSKITIRYNRVNHPINISEIIYIESLSDYIKIITEDDEIVTKEKISKIIERLPAYFKRTHRSFIVNSHKINSYNKEFVTLGNYQIPISRTYKTDFITYLASAEKHIAF